jgi:hypothetical protein
VFPAWRYPARLFQAVRFVRSFNPFHKRSKVRRTSVN